MNKIIEVKNLVKVYKDGKRAVDDITFDVFEGELFAFLGPNGAGKTTTISILTTVLSKTSGIVKICDLDVERYPDKVRERIGIIFQKPSIDKDLTGEENIRFHSVLWGIIPFSPTYFLTPQSYKDRLRTLVEIFGLKDSIFKPVNSYSGGMVRKLEIIRSLMHTPQILFLDEPTVGLDPEIRRNLWNYLDNVRKNSGTTIFITTHYLDEVENADKICIINQGKIVTLDSPAELKRKFERKFVTITYQKDIENALIQRFKKTNLSWEDLPGNIIRIYYDTFSDINWVFNMDGIIDIDINKPKLEDVYLKLINALEN